MKSGIELTAEERKRQVEVEGWTKEHDATHATGELSMAAACYAVNKLSVKARVQIYLPAEQGFFSGNTGDRGDRQLRKAGWFDAWPWNGGDKRERHDRKKSLIAAGALIAAELDRLNSYESPSAPVGQEGQGREAIERACLLALEFGYKQCEKGNNIQAAFLNYNEVVSPKPNKL